jgi:hypothetical protein
VDIVLEVDRVEGRGRERVRPLLEDPRPVSRSVNEQYGARRLFVSMRRHEAERSSAAQQVFRTWANGTSCH